MLLLLLALLFLPVAPQAPSRTGAPSSAQPGIPLSACAALTRSGSYYLTKDVSSPGTCFFIDADHVTLNLKGHTVTYGIGGGTQGTPAILLADSWYKAPGYSLARSGSADRHGGFVLFGGSIVSSPNAAPQSRGIWAGQSNHLNPAPVIHDVSITTTAVDASPIFGIGTPSGWQIYNNTLSYKATSITSRYAFYGYAIWIGDPLNASGPVPDKIYNNKILAAPQGGIADEHQNAIIGPHNNITFNSFYANDYCVIAFAADGQVIKENICKPTSGRGIDVESRNVEVTGNIISVTELPQVAEYKGCEAGGSDGIRVRDNFGNGNPTQPIGVSITGNTIFAAASKCKAVGIRMTYLRPPDTLKISGNTITTGGSGNAALADYAFSFEGVNQAGISFSDNSLTSRYAFVEVDWDGANASIDAQQKWLGSPALFIDNDSGFYDPNHTGPKFAQSITIRNSSGGAIRCGPYAAGLTQVGSAYKVCTAPKH
jgi:hypothetical protein